KGLVFPLGLPLCPLFTSFNSIADIPLSPIGGHYMLLLVRVKRSEIHSDTAPEAFVSGRQCCHGSVGCAHVNSPSGFTGGEELRRKNPLPSNLYVTSRDLPEQRVGNQPARHMQIGVDLRTHIRTKQEHIVLKFCQTRGDGSLQ
ncbi:MAG: hypothetical protein ABF689_14330, partial [Gluconobacter cerinus]